MKDVKESIGICLKLCIERQTMDQHRKIIAIRWRTPKALFTDQCIHPSPNIFVRLSAGEAKNEWALIRANNGNTDLSLIWRERDQISTTTIRSFELDVQSDFTYCATSESQKKEYYQWLCSSRRNSQLSKSSTHSANFSTLPLSTSIE